MAVDQAIAEYASATGTAVVRIYEWSEPTLSLGYFQRIADKALDPRLDRLPCVRRSTGGGAIVHDRELTYSMAVPTERAKGGDLGLYGSVHRRLCRWLNEGGWEVSFYGDRSPSLSESVGLNGDATSEGEGSRASEPFLCFERRSEFDLIDHGFKVLGSAQRRVGRSILQHGSLLLKASQAAPQLHGLWDVAPALERKWDLEPSRIAKLLVECLSEDGWRQEPNGELPDLTERTEEILATSFGDEQWTRRR